MTHLILSTRPVNRPNETINSNVIALAEDFLMANLTHAVSRAELADFADLSNRSLSRGFVKHHGMGPMTFLRTKRLDAVYKALLGADVEATNVTDIALRYGFTHLGKFAIEYKKAFGESPSTTLKN